MKAKILAVIPILLLTSCDFYNHYIYDDEGYQRFDGTLLELEGINKLDVGWVNGSVSIVQSDRDFLTAGESSSKYPFYYKIEEGCLSIKLAQSRLPSRIVNKLDKSLYVYLPVSFEEINVDAVNSSVYANVIDIKKDRYNCVRSTFSAERILAHETDFNLVSTNCYVSYMECYKEENIKQKVSIDAVESEVTFGVDYVAGYIVDWDGIRSTFTSDNKNQKRFGKEKLNIDFDGVKSSLHLNEYYVFEGEYQE